VALAQQVQPCAAGPMRSSSCCATRAELRRRLFGPRSEVIHSGQAEPWTDKVALPAEEHEQVGSHKPWITNVRQIGLANEVTCGSGRSRARSTGDAPTRPVERRPAVPTAEPAAS
jgi:hypothetical protein